MRHRQPSVAAAPNGVGGKKLHSLRTKIDTAHRGTAAFQRFFVLLGSYLRNLRAALFGNPRDYCLRHGHALPRKGWKQGQLPICPRCGDRIVNARELKASVLK